ncbi:MAG: hypothetical protein WBI07_16915 [Mobilitalea sp.]
MKYNVIDDGQGMADTEVNGKIISIKNYGSVMPKGYKLGFLVDHEEKEQLITSSNEFKEITGYDYLTGNGSTMIACAKYIIEKYCS